MYENTKKNIFQGYRNKQLMDDYERRKQQEAERQNGFSNGVGNTFKLLNGIDKAKQLFDKPYQPSAVGNAINLGDNANLSSVGNAINSNVMGNVGNMGSEIGSASTGATEGASSAAGGASQALGAAGSALAVGLDAKNMADNGINFNNGTDMAADAASLGLMATGVGAPAAAAIQAAKFIKNMVTSAIEKKKQKAMQASMKNAAEEEEKSINNLAEQQQGFDEVKQENAQKLQQQIDNQNQDTMTQQQTQVDNPNSSLVQNLINKYKNLNNGQVVGGASMVQPQGYSGTLPSITTPQTTPQTPMPTNYAEESMPTLSEEDIAEQQMIEQQRQNPQQIQQPNGEQPFMDKLRTGLSDFAAGYQDNANTDFAHGDLMNQVTGGASPVQGQNGTFNLGAQQNKKSVMARLGEMAGTGQRIMSYPLTQAGIAALVSKAAGGDIDDIAKAALQYGTQKAQADRYYQQITGNTDRPFLNSYTAQDVTNKRLEDEMAHKQQQWMYEQMIKQAQQDYKNQFEKEKFDYQKEQDKQKLDLQKEIHNARLQGKGGYGRYQGRPQSFDPTTVPGFYDDYESYEEDQNILNDPELYNKEWDDMLHAMYGDRWFYSDKQRQDAKNELDKRMNKNKNDFYRKYRINPMKGKKS